MAYDDFTKNDLLVDGVVRNLEIIGEAAKKHNFQLQGEVFFY